MEDTDSLDQIFDEVQRKFVKNLNRVFSLAKEFQEKLGSGKDLGNISEFKNETHKIAGSAKTFRFPNLSKIASSLESRLKRIDSKSLSDELKIGLEKDLNDFLSEIDQTIAGSPKNSSEGVAEEDHKSEVSCSPAGKFKILVADDDELVRTLLSQGLKKKDCGVIEAEDGQYAIDYLNSSDQNSLPDLIILDINMPRMNGFDVLKSLKEHKGWERIPVIMLTRRDEGENVVKGISTGAVDYISKPFKVPELSEKILKILTLQKIKVLITDDDELICDLLSQKFKKMGYSTIIANNGNDGLKMMKEEKPSIVILDIIMPGMDGLTVLKQAQSDPDISKIPIVLLTAKSQQDNLLKGLESGAHDYITKPFDVDEVAARVSGILQRSKKS